MAKLVILSAERGIGRGKGLKKDIITPYLKQDVQQAKCYINLKLNRVTLLVSVHVSSRARRGRWAPKIRKILKTNIL